MDKKSLRWNQESPRANLIAQASLSFHEYSILKMRAEVEENYNGFSMKALDEVYVLYLITDKGLHIKLGSSKDREELQEKALQHHHYLLKKKEENF